MASSEELRKAHLVILLPMGPVRLYQSPDVSVISALLSFVDYVVVYDKFGQHIYAGTLFAPPRFCIIWPRRRRTWQGEWF